MYITTFSVNEDYVHSHIFDITTREEIAGFCTFSELKENEQTLNAGRFKNFGVLFDSFQIRLNAYDNNLLLTWISENIKNKWYLQLEYKSYIYDIDYIWYFENKNDALLFKLSF